MEATILLGSVGTPGQHSISMRKQKSWLACCDLAARREASPAYEAVAVGGDVALLRFGLDKVITSPYT